MKDLDFDELDKAVNSLMASATKRGEAPEDDKPSDAAPSVEKGAAETQAVVIEPQPVAPVETKELQEPVQAAQEPAATSHEAQVEAEAEPATPTPAPEDDEQSKPKQKSLAIKRSGRFMDVVHPSSDMTQGAKPRATREGLTLKPLSQAQSPPEATSEPARESSPVDDANDLSGTSQTEESSSAAAYGYPDPIDLHGSDAPEEATETEQQVEESVEEQTVDANPETPDETPQTAAQPSESSDTPFLPDAKVEKRPLGGAQPEAPTSEATPGEPTQASQSLQEELDKHIVAIESDTTHTSRHHADPEDQHNSSPAQPAQVSSISQQYKTKESSDHPAHAALYDGNDHTLHHPPKKKSGWLTVLIILLLVVVGAAAAAGLYFAGII